MPCRPASICLTALILTGLSALTFAACSRPNPVQASDAPAHPAALTSAPASSFLGFDRNIYPGDDRLPELRRHFAFVGYWLTPPPGASSNTWTGKRPLLLHNGFGFLVLANGRLEDALNASHTPPGTLGKRDAEEAVAAARREGFPAATILFLDQEEGGRLTPVQAAYFFAWTETLSTSEFKPGAYLSGQPSQDGTGPGGKPLFITTAEDVRQQIAARHLHGVTFWVAQDACPPAPGCTAAAPPLETSGTSNARVWQFAQSPRRPALTLACAKTYASDGNCYAGISSDLFLDLDAADSPDPSHGR